MKQLTSVDELFESDLNILTNDIKELNMIYKDNPKYRKIFENNRIFDVPFKNMTWTDIKNNKLAYLDGCVEHDKTVTRKGDKKSFSHYYLIKEPVLMHQINMIVDPFYPYIARFQGCTFVFLEHFSSVFKTFLRSL